MNDEDAWLLLKHILAYTNDKNPDPPNLVVDLVFEPIKQFLKRDLEKWKDETIKRSEAGKKWMKTRWGNNDIKPITNNNSVINGITNITDSVSDSVSVSESVIKNKKKTTFSPPTLDEVKDYFTSKWYTEESGERAFEYYNVAWWIDWQGKQVRNWKQKMNSVWFKEENKKREMTMEQWRDLRDKMGIKEFTIKYWNEQAKKIMLYFL